MSEHPLDGSRTAVDLGDGYTILAPNVRGTVIANAPAAARARAFGSESFDALLESAGLDRAKVVEIAATSPPAGARGLGAEAAEQPAAELTVPRKPNEGVVVLVEDELGALTWVIPDEAQQDGSRALRATSAAAAPVLTFHIPLRPAPAAGTRGFGGGVLKKIVKIFTFPLEKIEDAVGDLVAGFVERWERKHRPYLVCTYGPQDYHDERHDLHVVTPADWSRLAEGRALLFVHGTFSSCDAFAAITPDVMAELARRYGGRVFAFNHPTMADDPATNAQRFLASVPTATPMTVDIVCHSRGGLVAREIAQQGAARGFTVGRIVMVGVPNGGTALANDDRIVGLVSRLTTLSKLFPSRAATIVVEALVVAVKVLARALLQDMAGLRAMNPAGDFIKEINADAGIASELFAIASNFEPVAGTPLFSMTRVEDAGADLVFENAENDCVVPTEGAFAVAAAGFPVPEDHRFVFAPEAGVVHTEYFGRAETLQKLTAWLEPDVTRDLAAIRARGLSAGDIEALRPHVINLTNGVLSRRGNFTTSKEDVQAIFDEHLPRWAKDRPAGQPTRVVVWAHGGLINEKDGLEIAHKHITWWKSNGIYPIYFVWETGLFDALGSLLAGAGRSSRAIGGRGFSDLTDRLVESVCRKLRGDLIWGAMKTNAEKCSARGGGALQVIEGLARVHAKTPLELHAIGHSAGSIFHSYFLPAAAKSAELPAFASLQLLAPAIRVDEFKQRLVPLLGDEVKQLTMYSMSDDYEQRDNCLGVYRKSLLYLIHHALESRDREPILGLQVSAANDPTLRTLFWGTDGEAPEATAIWSVSRDASGLGASQSTSHGGFDDDAATMTSVAMRVLGDAAASVKAYAGDARRGREWPLSAEAQLAIGAPSEVATMMTVAPAAVTAASVASGGKPAAAHTGRRLALCVGIDAYPAPDTLAGCVNDARAWKRVFAETLHFDRVDELLNGDATRANIVSAMKGLLKEAQPGDVVAFQYSGHGTSLPDDDGDERDDTDEALVPVDFASAQFLTDDDLRTILTEGLKEGVSLTLFMDCCHSGTITRMLGRGAPPVLPGVKARFMRFDPQGEIVQRYLANRPAQRSAGATRSFTDRSSLRWVNFSACDATEVAYESHGSGDFTRCATALLGGGIDISNAEFQRNVVKRFGENRRQTPQLDCPTAAEDTLLLQFSAVKAASTSTPAKNGAGDRRELGAATLDLDVGGIYRIEPVRAG